MKFLPLCMLLYCTMSAHGSLITNLPFKLSIRFLCNPVETIHIKQTCFQRFILEIFLVVPVCLLPEIRTGSSDTILSGDIVIAELIPDFEKTLYKLLYLI